jgi:hypothetical protein
LGGGLNIITGHQIAAEGDLSIPLSKMEEFETFDETFISEQLKIRYYNHRRVDVTKTQFMSIDNLLPKSKALGGGMNLQDDEFSGTNSDKNFEIEEEIVEEGMVRMNHIFFVLRGWWFLHFLQLLCHKNAPNRL